MYTCFYLSTYKANRWPEKGGAQWADFAKALSQGRLKSFAGVAPGVSIMMMIILRMIITITVNESNSRPGRGWRGGPFLGQRAGSEGSGARIVIIL